MPHPIALFLLVVAALLAGCGGDDMDPPDAFIDAAADTAIVDGMVDAPADTSTIPDASTDAPTPECGPGDPCGMKMSCCDGMCTSACCAGQVICGFVCCPEETGCVEGLPNKCA